jgi:hypothetical protein
MGIRQEGDSSLSIIPSPRCDGWVILRRPRVAAQRCPDVGSCNSEIITLPLEPLDEHLKIVVAKPGRDIISTNLVPIDDLARMSGGVDIDERIVPHESEPIQILRIPRLRHNRVRRDPTSQRRVVEPRPHVVQAHAGLFPLPREPMVRREVTPAVHPAPPLLAIRIVHSAALRNASRCRLSVIRFPWSSMTRLVVPRPVLRPQGVLPDRPGRAPKDGHPGYIVTHHSAAWQLAGHLSPAGGRSSSTSSLPRPATRRQRPPTHRSWFGTGRHADSPPPTTS